ncbi:MAG TPA: hypothetical protein VHG91_18880, partial [Longimicrobium sp.]|nr:hypothetical protein [Longimicrobium sp.]
AGPGDVAGRFQWWLRRLGAGGEVLAPGRPDAPVQVVDARDLGAWISRMVEGGGSGTYNAAGCDVPLTMRALLEAARAVAGSDARLTWVGDAFLLERGLNPWVELPFWERPEEYGTHRIDDRRARAAGLVFRPLLQTLRDVAAEGPLPVPALPVGITSEREAELLRAWHAHAAGHAPEEALAGAAA